MYRAQPGMVNQNHVAFGGGLDAGFQQPQPNAFAGVQPRAQAQPAQSDPNAMSEEDLRVFADRLEKEEQDRQYKEMIRLSELEEIATKKKAEEEKKRLEAEALVEAQKTNRADTLKKKFEAMVEPAVGDEVMNCVFRMPTGSRIARKFMKTEILKTLHEWIWIQENKGLEEEDAEFDLMSGYPPTLIQNYELTLLEAFPKNPKQELFIIKEVQKE